MRSDDPRLTRLRALIGKLERLPASTQRERALTEVRARIVDVETGEVPRVMRPINEPEAGSLAVPAAAAEDDAKAKRTPAVARRERAQAARRPVVAPVAPPVPPANVEAPVEVPADTSAPSLGSDGLLWLEDQVADDAEPGDGPRPAPWRRGLRG